ncbi:DUF2188 domain-containing protein [bacterium]|nr:DUF2188 domain-containing protein [bacterium]
MSKVIYEIVEHDGGWAYRVGGTFSEPFSSHDAAFHAARRAAVEQLRPGESRRIVWEDTAGRWHAEVSGADDIPETEVKR